MRVADCVSYNASFSADFTLSRHGEPRSSSLPDSKESLDRHMDKATSGSHKKSMKRRQAGDVQAYLYDMPALESISAPAVITALQDAIREAGGAEVYFCGCIDSRQRLIKVEVLARGNTTSVAAGMPIRPPWNLVIHNHPSGDLGPSAADVSVSAWLSAQEVAFFIIDNDASQYYAVTEPVIARVQSDIDVESLRDDFSSTGRIARLLDGYEPRTSQGRMAGYVAEICNSGIHGVIEAPTGTGKTLAYLLPLVTWALANGKRVLVSTHTINLQHQLFDKDIPFVKTVLEEDFSAVLAKGRSNYICRRRVLEGLDANSQELFPREDLAQLESLAAWMETSLTGDRAELAGIAEDLWDRVASDGDFCPGPRCSFVQECFFRMARRKAIEARIIVSNHALFCTDLALQRDNGASGGILPPVDRIVIDEAHNLEDVATDCFGDEVSAASISRQLGKLAQRGSRPVGVLHSLARLLPSLGAGADELAQRIVEELVTAIQELHQLVEPCFEDLAAVFVDRTGVEGSLTFRIESQDQLVRQGISAPLTRLQLPLAALATSMQEVASQLAELIRTHPNEEDEEVADCAFAVQQVLQFSSRLEGYAELLADFPKMSRRDMVYWIEQRYYRGRLRLSLFRSPLSVREILAEVLHSKSKGVIYTSATLVSGNGKFDFFANRIGLDLLPDSSQGYWQLPSEFDYQNRVLLAVNTTFPERPDPDFCQRFARFAHSFISATRGRIFFLFTSWRMLLECWDATMAILPEEMASTCLRQGDRDRIHLLTTFRSLPNAVLFGTSSFWEGVDVKGDRLIAIVLVRLPFMVPDDPLVSARMQEIEESGKSSFSEYSLPHAVIRFRQGFGRLMRTRDDYGIVVVLDPRIVTKRYGKAFLQGLPATLRLDGADQEISAAAEQLLARFE